MRSLLGPHPTALASGCAWASLAGNASGSPSPPRAPRSGISHEVQGVVGPTFSSAEPVEVDGEFVEVVSTGATSNDRTSPPNSRPRRAPSRTLNDRRRGAIVSAHCRSASRRAGAPAVAVPGRPSRHRPGRAEPGSRRPSRRRERRWPSQPRSGALMVGAVDRHRALEERRPVVPEPVENRAGDEHVGDEDDQREIVAAALVCVPVTTSSPSGCGP